MSKAIEEFCSSSQKKRSNAYLRHKFLGTINRVIPFQNSALTFFVACPQIEALIPMIVFFLETFVQIVSYGRLICIQSFHPANFALTTKIFSISFMTQFISLAAIDSMTSFLMSKAKAKNVNDIPLITSSAKNLGFCLNNKLKIGAVMASGTSVPLQASGSQM